MLRKIAKLIHGEYKVPTVLLMIGVDGVGKSTILRSKLDGIQPIPGSLLFECAEVAIGHNLTILNFDIGCQDKWTWMYLKNFHFNGVIFVVDSNDSERVPDSAEQFGNVVKHLGRHTPILFFANKQDLPRALSADQLTDRLNIHSHGVENIRIQPACATSKIGIEEGFEWLANEISKSNPEPNPFHHPTYQHPIYCTILLFSC